jgi:hypothetical protein
MIAVIPAKEITSPLVMRDDVETPLRLLTTMYRFSIPLDILIKPVLNDLIPLS